MPSVAQFIKELLSEDKYDSGFSDRIEERIQHLNAPQLQGMYNHLVATAKASKSDMWIQANKDIISKIEGLLVLRTAEAAKEEKMLEEFRLKNQHKKNLEKEARKEKKRVMQMIAETALKTAEDAVREEETKRQADEKIEIMNKVFVGEERRNIWWKRTAAGFVVCMVVVCAVVTQIYILIGCIFFICLVTSVLVYKAYHFTTVLPMVVDESLIELEVKKRQDVLKKKAISVLREKEQRFQEAMYKDKIEKKKRIKLRKERQRFEANLMETRRLEQIAMAKEAMSKKESTPSASASSSSKHASFEPTEDAIMELEDYHNPAGGGADSPTREQSTRSLVVPTSAEDKAINDFEHDEEDEEEEEEEDDADGPETSFSDLSRHDRSSSSRHNRHPHNHRQSYVDERRGLFSDDDSDFLDDSEMSGDVRDFSYAHGGVVSGDNSNICRLGDTRLFSDTNNGEEFSEYTPKANRDIESGLESPDIDEDTQTRTRSLRLGFGNTSGKSRNSNKYRPGNNNVDDHSKLNSRCESFSGMDIYSKDNSYSYSFAPERRNGLDDDSDCSVIDERTAENSVLVAGLSVECLLV